jgi:hypothetical protein
MSDWFMVVTIGIKTEIAQLRGGLSRSDEQDWLESILRPS